MIPTRKPSPPHVRSMFRHAALLSLWVIALAAVLHSHEALAQARNPFNVGISEGGGLPTNSFLAWAMAKQIAFERTLSGAVRAIKTDTSAVWTLMGLSFAYGVFHAAGPGHGKAVVSSYLFATEKALRRGLVISFAAAALQGLVAIAIVGILAVLLNATSQRMKSAANLVELASYGGVALLGIWLVWRKGRAFFSAWSARHAQPAAVAPPPGQDHAHHHDHGHHDHGHHDHGHAAHAHGHHDHDHGHAACAHADEPVHVHDEHCGHFHAPDPKTLGEGFSWKGAMATVLTAGARPCSGAILVLVFALAQGIFFAGVAATVAMSLGTAVTTGALAALAVLARGFAGRVAGEAGGGSGALVLVRGMELAAAGVVLAVGLVLFLVTVRMTG